MKHTTINISLYEANDLIRLGKEAGQMVPSLRIDNGDLGSMWPKLYVFSDILAVDYSTWT